MSEILLNKIEEIRLEMKILKILVQDKAGTTEGNEQLFWVNFLIEIKDIDYRLYDMEQTIPKIRGIKT